MRRQTIAVFEAGRNTESLTISLSLPLQKMQEGCLVARYSSALVSLSNSHSSFDSPMRVPYRMYLGLLESSHYPAAGEQRSSKRTWPSGSCRSGPLHPTARGSGFCVDRGGGRVWCSSFRQRTYTGSNGNRKQCLVPLPRRPFRLQYRAFPERGRGRRTIPLRHRLLWLCADSVCREVLLE